MKWQETIFGLNYGIFICGCNAHNLIANNDIIRAEMYLLNYEFLIK